MITGQDVSGSHLCSSWGQLLSGYVCVRWMEQEPGAPDSLSPVSDTLSPRVPQRYDPRHNRWFQIQSLQQEHADLCVCVVDGRIYAVAGRDYHNDLSTVECYDPATNQWTYVAPLQREVRGPFPPEWCLFAFRRWGVGGGMKGDVPLKVSRLTLGVIPLWFPESCLNPAK